MIFAIASFQIHADKSDRFVERAKRRAMNRVASATNLTASTTDSHGCEFVEREALAAYLEADHLKARRKVSSERIARPTSVEIMKPEKIKMML